MLSLFAATDGESSDNYTCTALLKQLFPSLFVFKYYIIYIYCKISLNKIVLNIDVFFPQTQSVSGSKTSWGALATLVCAMGAGGLV